MIVGRIEINRYQATLHLKTGSSNLLFFAIPKEVKDYLRELEFWHLIGEDTVKCHIYSNKGECRRALYELKEKEYLQTDIRKILDTIIEMNL